MPRRRRATAGPLASVVALTLCAALAQTSSAWAGTPRPSTAKQSSSTASTASPPASAAPGSSTPTSSPAPTPTSSNTPTSSSPPSALVPTRLVSLPSQHVADGTAALRVTLAAAVDPSTPMPMLTPRDAGTWKIEGSSIVFTPASTLTPCGSYTLTVWARTASTGEKMLGRKRTLPISVACPSTAALQQALARLGYLGSDFRPRHRVRGPSGAMSRAEAAQRAYHPAAGMLVPAFAGAPRAHIGQLEVLTRGALEVYQGDRELPVTGEGGPATWQRLIYDLTHYRRDPRPYTWVTVSESEPETLRVHRGGRVAVTTPANTGVAGAETRQGVFPIYARYVSTEMVGEDPDGTKYDVPDVPWVNYFNGGDAVHGYPRASYGSPQSNGCVELPIPTAQTVYGLLQIGDIVWVS